MYVSSVMDTGIKITENYPFYVRDVLGKKSMVAVDFILDVAVEEAEHAVGRGSPVRF